MACIRDLRTSPMVNELPTHRAARLARFVPVAGIWANANEDGDSEQQFARTAASSPVRPDRDHPKEARGS
jgi:hypothetical protein